jgi:ATP-dependent helicase HrpB
LAQPACGRGLLPTCHRNRPTAANPKQVTADLASFWANSYSDVRKDMAGRYPKHIWPVDPRNAEATRYTKKVGRL